MVLKYEYLNVIDKKIPLPISSCDVIRYLKIFEKTVQENNHCLCLKGSFELIIVSRNLKSS
jgi:hypothetical protein